ncbi:MAG: wax ester/triacylglycerol synthase family O-acyltransferase [Candidatus Promineifilaceae bacterium]|nr:wax ester/triacylglycerol synthase family O-acyltransferase [Candidatus Promineifilaceae bacterium]
MPRNSEPLSNVDAAWLGMDEPITLMMITGVMTFKKPLNIEHLRAIFEHRWLKFDRFKQRLVRPTLPTNRPYWETDPHFNFNAHFRRIALPRPGDQAALQQVVSDLMSTPLDSSKPLWQIHVIEEYGSGSAIVARIHHSIADGLALIYVLLSLTDMTPDAPWPEPAEMVDEEDDDGGLFSGALGSLYRGGRSVVGTAGRWSGAAVRGSWSTLRSTDKARQLMQTGADAGYATSRLLLRPDDPETPFKGPLGTVKRGAWSQPISLRDIKAIKNATRTTVNDVLIAAMSGALRRHMLTAGAEPVDFRATVPVNMRTDKEMGQLGNKFGLVFLDLPVGIADPLDRLAEVHFRMQELKKSTEAGIILTALNVVGRSAKQVQDIVVSILAKKATAVLTNVPGPPIPLFLAGREIEDIMFWVPQAGRLGMGISILSYAGKVYVGVATDAKLVSDPDRIIDAFYDELEELMMNLKIESRTKRMKPMRQVDPAFPSRPDDLTKIHGIEPQTAELLAMNGVINFDQLGYIDPGVLRQILSAGGSQFSHLDPSNWPAQARYLSNIDGSG